MYHVRLAPPAPPAERVDRRDEDRGWSRGWEEESRKGLVRGVRWPARCVVGLHARGLNLVMHGRLRLRLEGGPLA